MKAQVLLPKVFNFPFTYNSRTESKIGDLVEVPFGKKREIGVIWKNHYLEPKNIKIKDIEKKTEYSLNKKLVDFNEIPNHLIEEFIDTFKIKLNSL